MPVVGNANSERHRRHPGSSDRTKRCRNCEGQALANALCDEARDRPTKAQSKWFLPAAKIIGVWLSVNQYGRGATNTVSSEILPDSAKSLLRLPATTHSQFISDQFETMIQLPKSGSPPFTLERIDQPPGNSPSSAKTIRG